MSFPALKPILLILTSLSVIWDFRVFTQIYVLQKAGGITRDTNLLGVYAYRISIGENRFDVGAAVAVVMVAITIILTLVYLRRWCARRRNCDGTAAASKRVAINAAGALVALVALFPVYWMVLTSFKRNGEVKTLTPSFLPRSRR